MENDILKIKDKKEKYLNMRFLDNGVILVQKKTSNKYCIINDEYKISKEYNAIYSFQDGYASVLNFDNKLGKIDLKGNEVIPCKYNYIEDKFYDGLVMVGICKNDVTLFGFCDKTGKEVIPCQYQRAENFSDGIACVGKVNDYGEVMYGYINTKGKKITELKYDDAGNFHEGFAYVYNCDFGKYGFLKKDGKLLVRYVYDNVQNFQNGFASVSKNGYSGFINTEGKEVIPCQYLDTYNFSDGLAAVLKPFHFVYKNKRYSYIDTEGKEVIPPKFKYPGYFNNGIAKVTDIDDNEYYIDKNGDYLFGLAFSSQISFLGKTETVYANSEKELNIKKLEVIKRFREEYSKVNEMLDEAANTIEGNCRLLKK